MPNYYETSTGERVSQATIDRRRSAAYKEYYGRDSAQPWCAGCGRKAEGTAHAVPQHICKKEKLTEYCWLPINFIPACHKCNDIMENWKGEEIKKLFCYQLLLSITKKILPSRYEKMIL